MKQRKVWKLILSFLLVVFCLALGWLCSISFDDKKSVVIKTTSGYVQGIEESGVSVFKGVPYAAAPVGILRFKPPRPCPPWEGVLQTTRFAHAAAQISDFTHQPTGSENALFLNVYTPLIRGKKLPVFFWIHGGAMVTGSGSLYNGHAFADKDSIVVVNINYRLGILGFTYLDDLGRDFHGSGNNGLLDCIAALRWVRQNIDAFGGDPERITIAGQSAGAKLACTMAVCPQASGLFHQLIAERGGVQSIRDIQTANETRHLILKALHLKEGDAVRLLTIPSKTLLEAQKVLANGTTGVAFLGPIIDHTVLQEDPYRYISEGKTTIKSALIGNNRTEITSFYLSDKQLKKPTETTFDRLSGENAPYVMENYREKLKTQDSTSAATDVLSQYLYIMHSFRLAEALDKKSIPVYLYRFDYAKGIAGAGHGTELPFVWYHPLNTGQPFRDQIFEAARLLFKGATPLAQEMHHSWALFIKQGNPSQRMKWKNYTHAHKAAMLFKLPLSHPVELDSIFNDRSFPASGFALGSVKPRPPAFSY